LIAHTVSNATDDRVKGHFTAYGESAAAVDELVAATKRSPLTSSVSEMQRRYEFEHHGLTSGYTTKELFVEYDPGNTISDGLIAQGFIQDAPVRIRDGLEYWSVFVENANREELHDRLNAIREEYGADISVTKIYSHETRSADVPRRVDTLSERQREIYELACDHGYYSWPRETTTTGTRRRRWNRQNDVARAFAQGRGEIAQSGNERFHAFVVILSPVREGNNWSGQRLCQLSTRINVPHDSAGRTEIRRW